MRNCIFSTMLICLIALAGTARGQSYDFVLGGCTTPWQRAASVKAYSPTQAVAAFVSNNDNRRTTIALVGVAATMNEVTLDRDYFINDIDIVGDFVYFCGTHNGSSMLGCADLTTFGTPNPLVQYYDISLNAQLHHLVAYKTSGGRVKVVTSGSWLDNSTPCNYPYIYGTYSCQHHFLTESDFSGINLNNFSYIKTTNAGCSEMVCDIVRTDNHVGVVTNYLQGNAMALHRCDPNNVLSTYWADGLTYYPVADYHEGETGYIACRMNGDSLAVASVALRTGAAYDFYTHVRVFDLSSMSMTHAQQIPLSTKPLLYDMVYMPRHSALVLLQEQDLPASNFHSTFVYLEPFSPAPYTATGAYDATLRLPFIALDAVDDNHFVSTGGNYWLLKDMTTNDPANTCYKFGNIRVNRLNTVAGIFQPLVSIRTFPLPNNLNNRCFLGIETLQPLCIINN